MICPKCKGENVNIAFVAEGSRTSSRGTGFGGNMSNTARAVTAMSTLGMSNLVWKKSKGTHHTKNKNTKKALCQDCGNDWKIR